MTVGLLQRKDGTVLRHCDCKWEYLSPLFGEWLPCFTPTQEEMGAMQPYPSGLNVPAFNAQDFIQTHQL